MLKYLSSILLLALTTVGCHGQVPPASTGYNVDLSWSAPLPAGTWLGCGSGQPSCVYAVYRCVGTAAACANFAGTNWTEITTPITRPSGLVFVDTTATGLTVNYTVETVQGNSNSGPSNTYNVAVPGIPLAPSLTTPLPVAASLVIPNANPVMSQVAPQVLMAKVEKR